MSIDRHNYEEYFILYLDNELDSERRRQVELFAQANPDLKAELDMLLQSKLTPDTDIVFDNKESLLIRNSASISLTNYEEWLIVYIDNELTNEERGDVERFVAANPAIQKELALFQKTKLQPETIVFPGKESLYHQEEKTKVIAIRWWRMAAAAVLLLGISTTAIVLLDKNSGNSSDPGIANTTKNNSTITPVSKQVTNTTVSPKEEIADNNLEKNDLPVKGTSSSVVRKENNANVSKEKTPEQTALPNDVIANVEPNKQTSNNLPQPDQNPNVISGQNTPDIAQAKTDPEGTLTNSIKNTTAGNVTPPDTHSYNNQQQAAGNPDTNSEVTYASQKSGLRGFFRKVTRTLEKKTNIKATDDDDRLLIAGLSLKLN